MSTALLYCGTSEGFVIGADSLGVNLQTGRAYDYETKIFAFENSLLSVVFGWAGCVKVIGSSFGAVDLVTETYESLSRLASKNSFASDLANDLRRKLSIFGVNTTGRHATGIFLSFVNGAQLVSEIAISKNGRSYDCATEEGTANGDVGIVSGPEVKFDKPVSLSQARGTIDDYINNAIANSKYPDIGGYAHIGKLTSEGFDWIIPPYTGSTP